MRRLWQKRPASPTLPPTTDRACLLHATHRPTALTTELHHVIPRAWQRAFTPPYAPFPGTYDGQKLWDAREIPLAPTCHRNVHFHIVALMRDIAGLLEADLSLSEAAALSQAIASVPAAARRDTQFVWATQAPTRFIAASGTLAALIAAGEWGEA